MCFNVFTAQRERSGKENLYITSFHELQELKHHAADYLFGSYSYVNVGFQRLRRWNSGNERL